MILDKVKEVIGNTLEINTDDISMETSFEDLNVDSLDLFQIIIDIEEEFNIKIENAESIKPIEDLVCYIENNTDEK